MLGPIGHLGPKRSEPQLNLSGPRGCKCGCTAEYKERKAFEKRNAALWEAARNDPNDLSYVEAVALARERQDRSIHEEEVQFARERAA